MKYLDNEYIEDKIYGIALKEYKKLGMYIYYPPKGDSYCIEDEKLADGIDIRRHFHLDGRGHLKKEYNKKNIDNQGILYGLYDPYNKIICNRNIDSKNIDSKNKNSFPKYVYLIAIIWILLMIKNRK